MKIGMDRVMGMLLLVVCCLSLLEASALNKRSLPRQYFENELAEKELQPLTEGHDFTSRLIMRLIDTAIEDARERGLREEDLQGLMRKRSGIRKCFFHAVNCW